MKKKIKNAVLTSIMLCMLVSLNASAVTKTLALPQSMISVTAGTETRTKKYSTVYVRLNSVSPPSGVDTFTKARVKLYNGSTAISDEKTLTEVGAAGAKSTVTIKEGYLDKSSVTFKFYGNNANYAATASVYYDAR